MRPSASRPGFSGGVFFLFFCLEEKNVRVNSWGLKRKDLEKGRNQYETNRKTTRQLKHLKNLRYINESIGFSAGFYFLSRKDDDT